MKKNCRQCGTEFDAPEDPILNRFTPFCQKCADDRRIQAEKEAEERIRIEREQKWLALCPPAFRATEISKLPLPQKAEEVLAWNYGPTGLLLHGPTGRGKSRCAWLAVK